MAEAMGCRFVYAVIPEQEIEEVIKQRALQKARAQVKAASTHMALEAQSLNDEQLAFEVERIEQAARRHFGKEARVWLFGSRADDTQRGGDIDLYIETRMTDSRRLFQAEINFLADVKTLNPSKPPESWKFDGRIALAASYEEGNTEKDKFKIDGDMQLYKYPHRFKTYFEGSLEKNFNITTLGRLAWKTALFGDLEPEPVSGCPWCGIFSAPSNTTTIG